MSHCGLDQRAAKVSSVGLNRTRRPRLASDRGVFRAYVTVVGACTGETDSDTGGAIP
jgi:hypothetical protein